MCESVATRIAFRKECTDYRDCATCGFRFSLSPTNPNFANTVDDYEDAYLQYLAPDQADRANLASLRQWMERLTSLAGKRVLDVGAGSGKFVRFLKASGIDACGIEPSTALFNRFLHEDSSFRCLTLDRLLAIGEAPYDVITAFDVIEHVERPQALLADIVNMLTPGGALFLSTPDVGSLIARLFGRRWHFYYPYHLSYFSPQTLARAAGSHGLALVDSCHRGRLRSAGYMVRYAAEFIGGRAAPAWASRLDSWYLPVNLFDTMYLCFRREGV
jgi:SAM-dependent methyltransferase